MNQEADGAKFALKIGDLGVSRKCSLQTQVLDTFYGTPLYASPEICENKPYTKTTDTWSLGVLYYELCELHVPFSGESLLSLAQRVCEAKYKPLEECVPKAFRSAVEGMLQVDPAHRLTLDQVENILASSQVMQKELNRPAGHKRECLPDVFPQVKAHSARRSVPKNSCGIQSSAENVAEADNCQDKKSCAQSLEGQILRLEADLRRKELAYKTQCKWGGDNMKERDETMREVNALRRKLGMLKQASESDRAREKVQGLKGKNKYYLTCPLPDENATIVKEEAKEKSVVDTSAETNLKASSTPSKTTVKAPEVTLPSLAPQAESKEELDYVERMHARSKRLAARLEEQHRKVTEAHKAKQALFKEQA